MMPDDVHLIKEVRALRSRRLLRTLAVVQDFSDALMAINDITGDLPMRLMFSQQLLAVPLRGTYHSCLGKPCMCFLTCQAACQMLNYLFCA